MNQLMLEQAQAMMAEAEELRKELEVTWHPELFALLEAEYERKFALARDAVHDAITADPE